jgi:hypothetical protein
MKNMVSDPSKFVCDLCSKTVPILTTEYGSKKWLCRDCRSKKETAEKMGASVKGDDENVQSRR